jgi:hypothetical protein
MKHDYPIFYCHKYIYIITVNRTPNKRNKMSNNIYDYDHDCCSHKINNNHDHDYDHRCYC